MADLLENVAIKPQEVSFVGISQIEVRSRPLVPDNIEHQQVFEDDKDIINFLLNEDKYHGQEMDYSDLVETIDGKETLFGEEVIQLKTSKVPKGLVVLENMLDNQDREKYAAKYCKPQ